MRPITTTKEIPNTFRRDSEYFFKYYFIGELYEKWTDYLTDNGVKIVVRYDEWSSEWIKTTGYAPDIINMSWTEEDTGVWKIQWNHTRGGIIKQSDESKEVFAKLFCIDGWKHEESYSQYSDYGHTEYKKGYAKDVGDIQLNTLPWVEYLTFQGSRTILKINIFEYYKTIKRSEQIDSLLGTDS